jgi:hypothetical protein
VHGLVRRGRLLRVKDSTGHVLYPANQFDRHGRPFPLIGRLIETGVVLQAVALGRTGWG